MPLLCFYCAAPLTEANRSLAHVVPNSLGGRLASFEICCASCNNSFTSIESECAARLAAPGATLGARKGDGKAISATIHVDGAKFRASGSAMHEEAPPPSENGRVWALPAELESQISWLAVALRQHKLPPEALLDGTLRIVDAPPEPDPPGLTNPDAGVGIEMSWGDPLTKRLMVKCACELLAHAKPDLARAAELRATRRHPRADPRAELRRVLSSSTTLHRRDRALQLSELAVHHENRGAEHTMQLGSGRVTARRYVPSPAPLSVALRSSGSLPVPLSPVPSSLDAGRSPSPPAPVPGEAVDGARNGNSSP